MASSVLAQSSKCSRTRLSWVWVALLLWLCMATASAQEWSYRVRPGDTLWDLSGEYLKPDIAWQKLQAHNQITNPYSLPPGSTLRFPLAWLRMQPAKAKVLAVKGESSVEGLGSAVASVVSEGMELGIGALLRTGKGASLIHCFAGKDRTGVSVALAHHVLGVHADDMLADYLLTNQVMAGRTFRGFIGGIGTPASKAAVDGNIFLHARFSAFGFGLHPGLVRRVGGAHTGCRVGNIRCFARYHVVNVRNGRTGNQSFIATTVFVAGSAMRITMMNGTTVQITSTVVLSWKFAG